MCYSALVEQSPKKLAHRFNARPDEQAFLKLFQQRANAAEMILEGVPHVQKVNLAKNLEWEFLRDPTNAIGIQTKKEIIRWQDLEEKRLHAEIEKQTERVKKAEASLEKKSTLKVQSDLRIGTGKIKKAQKDLDELRRPPTGEDDSWIWPKYHLPGMIYQEGKRIIRPFRYLIRPQGQPEDFDEKYNGAYNAQQERLDKVFFWRELFGKNHGYFLVHRFRERQDEELTQTTKPRKEFEFNPGHPILVPFLWDHWIPLGIPLGTPLTISLAAQGKQHDLWSAAAITCEPPDEVKKNGIRRLLTPLKEEFLEDWENPSRDQRERYKEILADYDWPELEFAAVA